MYNKNPVFAETFIFSTLQKLQQLRENTCLPELNPCTMMVQYRFGVIALGGKSYRRRDTAY